MEKVTYSTTYRYEPNMEVKTVAIDLIYILKRDLDNVYNIDLMKKMISTTATGYETETEFRNELLRRLIIGYSVQIRDTGNTTQIRFSLTVPKENLIEDYSIDDAISFFKNAIFNPYIEGNGFSQIQFDLEKEALLKNMINSKNSIYAEAERKYMDIVDPAHQLRQNYEYNLDLINKSTRESVYEFYKENILKGNYLLYIGGCIEEESAKRIYEEHFKQEISEFEVELDYYNFFKPNKEEYHEETFNFNQSALFIEFLAEGINKENIEYFSLLANILSTSENDLVFKSLRLENNLVYFSYANKLLYNGMFYVETYLRDENKDKAIEVIKDILVKLKNKEFLKQCIDRLIEGIELDLIRELDRKYQKLETRINDDLKLRNLNEILECYKSMDIDEIITYIDKIKVNNILFIKGDSNAN